MADKQVCDECGKLYPVGNRQYRNMCHACYVKWLRAMNKVPIGKVQWLSFRQKIWLMKNIGIIVVFLVFLVLVMLSLLAVWLRW